MISGLVNMGRFVDPAFRYSIFQGPDKVDSETDAQRNGLNCIALAHLAVSHIYGGQHPKPWLNFYELYSDTTRSVTLDTAAAIDGGMEQGDLVWFGLANPPVPIEEFQPEYINGFLANWEDRAVTHVAVYTGEGSRDDSQMLHATQIEGTNVIWPLGEFRNYSRYEHIYRVSRLVGAQMLNPSVTPIGHQTILGPCQV